MAFSVFQILLVIIHALYSLAVYAHRLFFVAKEKWEGLLLGEHLTELKDEIDYISATIKTCRKVPSHLVIIIGVEDISVKDLTNLAVWSLAAGVTFVTFYDYTGNIKKYKSDIGGALAGASKTNGHIVKKNGFKNGCSTKPTPHISLFDLGDGKEGIVRVVKHLCEQTIAGQLRPDDVHLDYMDILLAETTGVPEPELALYCGEVCSPFGFLPWHTRITEFLPLPSHHNVKVQTFMALLRRYDTSEQRFGK